MINKKTEVLKNLIQSKFCVINFFNFLKLEIQIKSAYDSIILFNLEMMDNG